MGVMTSTAVVKLYERIANMMILQVAHEQIANAMGVTLEILEQIKTRTDFTEVFDRVTEQYDKQLEIDVDWNTVESRALNIVKDNLAWSKDPEYALKAAGIANKAARRNGTGNQPLPARVGTRININLSGSFVDQMKILNGDSEEVPESVLEKKPTGLLELVQKSKDEIEDQKKFDDLVTPADLKNMFALESADAEVQANHFFGARLDLVLAED